MNAEKSGKGQRSAPSCVVETPGQPSPSVFAALELTGVKATWKNLVRVVVFTNLQTWPSSSHPTLIHSCSPSASVSSGRHGRISETGMLERQKCTASPFWRLEVRDRDVTGLASSKASLPNLRMAAVLLPLRTPSRRAHPPLVSFLL